MIVIIRKNRGGQTVTQFSCNLAELKRNTYYNECTVGMLDPGSIAENVFSEINGGELFAYLFRRFGYPNIGWDKEKQLVEYAITTPIDDLFLTVFPYTGGNRPDLMFGYSLSRSIEEAVSKEVFGNREIPHWEWEKWSPDTLLYRCNEALKQALLDLKRPVYIRDIAINCLGKIKDELDTFDEPAKVYEFAGYAIKKELLINQISLND